MPGGQRIRVINRTAFMVWACSPKNWVYFDVKKVRDPHLKRLLKLKATRWGDEWWRPRQMAAYHGMEETKLIHQNIKFGLLESFRIPVSYSGVARDDRLCSPRFILKSVAIRHKFLKRGEFHKTKFTLAADAWLLKAHDELGMTFVEIARTMKLASSNVIRKRYLYLKQGKGK